MADFIRNEDGATAQQQSEQPAPAYDEKGTDQNFTRHEPMSYEAPKQPIPEAGSVLVTPLSRVGANPVDVDCPYCKAVRRTQVRQDSTGDDSMTQCLICLVCWPALFCYETNKDTNHYCTVCKRQLTKQLHGAGPVQVIADANQPPEFVPSRFPASS